MMTRWIWMCRVMCPFITKAYTNIIVCAFHDQARDRGSMGKHEERHVVMVIVPREQDGMVRYGDVSRMNAVECKAKPLDVQVLMHQVGVVLTNVEREDGTLGLQSGMELGEPCWLRKAASRMMRLSVSGTGSVEGDVGLDMVACFAILGTTVGPLV